MSAGCTSCGGRCCRGGHVAVTVFDAWRIAKKLRLRWTEFVDPMVTGRRGPMGLALRKDANDPAACTFLAPLNGGGRCRIYPLRPQVCVVYPFGSVKGEVVVRDGARCVKGDIDLSLVDIEQTRGELVLYAAEQDGHSVVLDVWDAGDLSDRTFARFCDYAEAALDDFFLVRGATGHARPFEIADANGAWLTDLETSCRAALQRLGAVTHPA
jgi:Fe-S-cluster containining protein